MSLKIYLNKLKKAYAGGGLSDVTKTAGTIVSEDLSKILDSFAGKATLAVGATALLYTSLNKLSDAYNLSYDSALKNTQANLNNFNGTKAELDTLNSQAESYKETLASIAEANNIKIKPNDSIDDLYTKLNAADLSVDDKSQVQKIKLANDEVKRQTAVREKLAEQQHLLSASDASDALNKGKQSVAQQVAQNVPGGKKTYQGLVENVNVVDAAQENVSAIKEYEKAIAGLESKQADYDPGSSEWKEAENDINSYRAAIETLSSDLDVKQNDLSALLASFSKNGEGLVAETGYEEQFKAVKKALNSVNNMDLAPEEQWQQSINDFFDGTSGKNFIKDRLLEAAKSGEDVVDVLHNMGLTLGDLGMTGKGKGDAFRNYFDGLKKSAEEAEETVSGIDGSFEGVNAAFSSQNAGDKWNSMAGYIEQAQQLYEDGKIGTDDFQSVAQWMAPQKINTEGYSTDAEAYKAAWEKSYNQVKNWFDTSNPYESMHNFARDLEATENDVGKNLIDINEETGKIVPKFESTAEAAKALGVNTDVVDTILHNMEDYGYEFDGIMFSGEGLKEYETSLDGIKEIYDTMNDSASKDRLGKLIEGWDEEYDKYEEDLSTLTEEQIVHIKFEYDQASIQAQIEELEVLQKAEGGKNSETNAGIIAGYESYIENAKEGLGLNEEGVELPIYFKTSEDTVNNLYQQLKDAKKGSDEYFEIQAKIQNQEELQQAMYDEFSEENPDINNESDPSEITAAWENFFSQPRSLEVDAHLGEEEVLAQLDQLSNGSTITFSADVNGVEQSVTAIKDKDGIITYTTEINGETTQVQLNKNGTVTYNVNANAVNGFKPTDKDGKANFTPETSAVDTWNPPQLPGDINYKGTFGNVGSPPVLSGVISYAVSSVSTGIGTIINGFKKKGKKVNGTAHSRGTALWQYRTSGTHAYGSGSWGLPHSERALINELGSEIIVRGGRWFTLNNGYPTMANLKAGDIVFNHKQTEALLNNGYVTGSHARLVGSSFAEGSLGHISGRAYASGTEFKQEFDQLEILIDRMESAFKRISDSVETLSYNLTAQNRQMDSAIAKAKSNLSVYQKAYDTYMSKANAVGLSGSWVSAVQNGSYDVSNITDEDLKDKIDDYKKYYEKALGLQKDIADLQKDLVDLAMKKLSNIDNYFSNRFDYNDDFGYANQISELNSALSQYQNELAKQVSSGTIKQYSDEWYDAQKKIADYTQKILDATWKKFEDTLDHMDRVSDNLKDFLSLKEAKGEPLTEADYQKQIDLNNASIQKSYDLRQQLVKKQAVYDVGSKLYDSLAKEIAGLDSDIYDLMENNEKLKKSIWETRFTNPFEEIIDGLDATISSSKNLRSLLDKDSFFDESGALTDNGLANLALLGQEMAASKQKVAEYTAALKKLDEAYQNGILSQKDYDKSQKNMLKDIQDAAGDVQDYKDKIIDLYKDQMKAEIDYMDDYYDKRQKALDLDKKYYDFSKKMNAQTKSVNQLKAQISALQGVNNASAQAELRRLEQELAEKEEDLSELKKDHADDMIDRGYDKLSSGLKDSLNSTMDELTYNADMQEQVVADMLGKVVAMYGQAYGKINEIIANTGFAGSSGFNQNIANLGTQAGAAGQAVAGSAAQGSIQASGAVSDVNTGAINQNPSHGAILDEISKETDINNRPVAELTLSTSSLSLNEGKSAVVTARIRPTDAANKTLRWTSSNTKAATVSGGTIKGVKAGSAVITCSTTDGSGISASVSVSVTPAPAKPAPSQNAPSYGGIPFRYKKDYYPKNKLNVNSSIVDRLKSHDFDSSMSACRELYNYWGGGGYYSGTYSQNVWLLNKMRSAGYRRGTRSVPISGPDFIHDGELVIRKSDGGILVPLQRGDGVIPSGLTENLWDLAERAPQLLSDAGLYLPLPAAATHASREHTLNAQFSFGTLLNIEGNADKDIVDELKSALPALGKELTKIVSSELSDDYRKLK
ncbi:hypothetical protein LAJLEIBI_02065 [[Clostridium] hylemonae DSM 15053]|nr:hypothetical protein LAJLEIBI_02065 [[Clostridium] hylemonae DSM 15053]